MPHDKRPIEKKIKGKNVTGPKEKTAAEGKPSVEKKSPKEDSSLSSKLKALKKKAKTSPHKVQKTPASKAAAPKSAPKAAAPPKEDVKKKKMVAVFQKLKQIAAAKPKEKKEKIKGRVYRSIRDRSKLPLLVALIILSVLGGILWVYQSGMDARLIENLKSFEIPTAEELENFRARNNPNLAVILEKGPDKVPVLVNAYPQMDYRQKLATVILLGELKRQESMVVLIDAMMTGDPMLASQASHSAAKLQDMASGPLLEKIKTVPSERKPYFIDALSKTGQREALQEILKLCQDSDPKIRKTSVKGLAHFHAHPGAIQQLFESLSDAEKEVADESLSVLREIQSRQMLGPNANELSLNIKKAYDRSKEPENRARLLRAMGIVGVCMKDTGENYVDLFKNNVREAFKGRSMPEKIAAAYALGRFQDEEMLTELMDALDSDEPELTKTVATALTSLTNQNVCQLLLSKKFSEKPHVLWAIARILFDDNIYVRRMELTEKAIDFLMRSMKKAQGEVTQRVATTLSIYLGQPVENMLFRTEDLKDPVAFIEKVKADSRPMAASLKSIAASQLDAYDGKSPSGELLQTLVDALNQRLSEENLLEKSGLEPGNLSKGAQLWAQKKEGKRLIHLNRLLIEATFPAEIARAPFFTLADIKFPEFIQKIRTIIVKEEGKKKADPAAQPSETGDKRDPLSRHLWHQLSQNTQQMLDRYDPSAEVTEEIQDALLDELNRLIVKGPLYEERLFKGVKVGPETTEMLKKKLSAKDVSFLNRLLLEQSYPNEMEPLRGKAAAPKEGEQEKGKEGGK